ncbi:MAG: hypothetical protein IPG53_07125 [Ignavibacteriales bacterium]|nr:hypothetical protein [Ignavibacteriales bacterium]
MKQADNYLISTVLDTLKNEYTLRCELYEDQFLTIRPLTKAKKFKVDNFFVAIGGKC